MMVARFAKHALSAAVVLLLTSVDTATTTSPPPCGNSTICTLCPGQRPPGRGVVRLRLVRDCAATDKAGAGGGGGEHVGVGQFGPHSDVTIYGAGGVLNGSIVSRGASLRVNNLTLTGSIVHHGKILTVKSVTSLSRVAVIATLTDHANINITDTSSSEYIAAFAHIAGTVTFGDKHFRNGRATKILLQQEDGAPKNHLVFARKPTWVTIIDIGVLLNVFGSRYEAVFYDDDLFTQTSTPPARVVVYASAVAVAAAAVLFLTHAGELTRVANVYASRPTNAHFHDKKLA